MVLWANTSHADMAIAVGITGNIKQDGFVWGGGFDANRQQTALDGCRGVKALSVGEIPDNVSKAQRLCKIVADFKDQCFAMANDGGPHTPGTGVGWAVEDNLRAAEGQALAKCEAMTGPAGGGGVQD
jgi:hypothetical protein